MTSTANFTGRSSSKTPRAGISIAAEGSPAGRPLSVRHRGDRTLQRPYAVRLRRENPAGNDTRRRRRRVAFRAKSWRGTSAPEPPAARHPPHSSLRSTPSRPGTSTHASVSTTCVLPTPGKPGATPTRRRAAPSPPSARSSTPGAATSPCDRRDRVYAKEPSPQGTGSLYGIIDYFAGKYTLRVTNREAEFSGIGSAFRTTRPTAGRPARTTRAGVTAATPPTAYP